MATRLRVVFMGSPALAVPSLERVVERHDVSLVVTQPDKPVGRGQKVQPPPIKQIAVQLGIPVIQPATLKGTDGGAVVAAIRAERPDVLVVVAYGKILPDEILGVPRLGAFNLHGSLLPKHRGAAPIQWAVINGDPITGVCIMRIERGLDSGPVLAQLETPIGLEETSGDLFGRLAQLGAGLLVESLEKIADGTATETPQLHGLATIARMLRKEDGRLDFSASARAVSSCARGVDPWPGAYAELDGEPVKLFRPKVVSASGAPGEILAAGPQGLLVACGTDAVVFAEMQLPGRKRLPVGAVVSGRPVAVGTLLR